MGFGDELDIPEELDIDIDSESFEDTVDLGIDEIYHEVYLHEGSETLSLCIDFDDIYVISVFQDDQSRPRCIYEPPTWLKAKPLRNYRDHINYTVVFIQRLVAFFNEKQQKFLENPILENIQFEKELNQKIFVENLSDAVHKFQESDFSNFCDKVWFIWSDKSFCLKSIF